MTENWFWSLGQGEREAVHRFWGNEDLGPPPLPGSTGEELVRPLVYVLGEYTDPKHRVPNLRFLVPERGSEAAQT